MPVPTFASRAAPFEEKTNWNAQAPDIRVMAAELPSGIRPRRQEEPRYRFVCPMSWDTEDSSRRNAWRKPRSSSAHIVSRSVFRSSSGCSFLPRRTQQMRHYAFRQSRTAAAVLIPRIKSSITRFSLMECSFWSQFPIGIWIKGASSVSVRTRNGEKPPILG